MKLFLIITALVCEIVRPSFHTDYIINNNTLSDCQTQCLYDDNCMGLIYENNTCLIGTDLEITDNEGYNNTNQIVYSKKPFLKYYSQKCGKLNKKKCNKFKGCKWKGGSPSYINRPHRRGWCGRISC